MGTASPFWFRQLLVVDGEAGAGPATVLPTSRHAWPVDGAALYVVEKTQHDRPPSLSANTYHLSFKSPANGSPVQVLTEIPCGVESPWHIHPGEEARLHRCRNVKMMIQDQPTASHSRRRPRGLSHRVTVSLPRLEALREIRTDVPQVGRDSTS